MRDASFRKSLFGYLHFTRGISFLHVFSLEVFG